MKMNGTNMINLECENVVLTNNKNCIVDDYIEMPV